MEPTLIRDILPDLLGLDEVSFLISELVGFVGVSIMAYGSAMAAWHFALTAFISRKTSDLPLIRIQLGKYLALGLEFLVGKDIIESIVRPSWDDLGKLAALIALRTAVTFMLSWELKEIKQELDQEALQRTALKKLKQKRVASK